MRYSGWHLLGTARMGDDPATSVLDRWNRAHDVPNLYVVDGSCFVTVGRRQPDIDDLRPRAARRRPHGRDPVRAAGAGMSATTRSRSTQDPLATLDPDAGPRSPPSRTT